MQLQSRIRYDSEYAALSARRPAAAHAHYFPGNRNNLTHTDPVERYAYWWHRRVHFRHTAVSPHDHDYYEVVLVCSGRATHVLESGEYPIQSGSVLVIPPRVCHAYEDLDHLFIINLYYITEWLADDLKTLWQEPGLVHLFLAQALFQHGAFTAVPRFHLAPEELSMCLQELREIREERERPNPSALLIKAALLKTLVRMSAAYMREAPTLAHASFRPEVWLALDEVETCIASSTPFNVAAMARRSGISPEHLVRLFKAATGHSLMGYYQRRRVQYGTRMLLRPDVSITDIAHHLGYCDSSHFSRIFARYHGLTPSAYRSMLLTHDGVLSDADPTMPPLTTQQEEASHDMPCR